MFEFNVNYVLVVKALTNETEERDIDDAKKTFILKYAVNVRVFTGGHSDHKQICSGRFSYHIIKAQCLHEEIYFQRVKESL
jgi:hypothetical protein